MRIEPFIPGGRPILVRRVLACDPLRVAVLDLRRRCCACPTDAPISFSSYLEKHNREDRTDLNRTAMPLFVCTPGAPVGGVLDVLG